MALSCATVLNVQAQVSAYSFSRSVGTYAEITGGISLLNASATTNVAYADGTGNPQTGSSNGHPNFLRVGAGYPIGFDFTYNNMVFDRIGVSPSGWISLGSSANGATAVYVHGEGNDALSRNVETSGTNVPPANRLNRIAALNSSALRPRTNAGTEGSLRIETVGTAPNQVCVIQWKNYRQDFSGSNMLNFQIRLNQIDNTVHVIYKDPATEWLSSYFGGQVGLRGSTTNLNATDWNRVATPWDAPSNTYTWNTLTEVLVNNNLDANTAYFGSTYVTRPVAGTTLTWTPPSCLQAATALLASPDTGKVDLSWTGTGSFQYAIGTTNNVAAATITGSVTVNSVQVTGLDPATTYYAFVRTDCGSGDYSKWSPVTSFTTWATAACGADWYDVGGATGGLPSSALRQITAICPGTSGDVVTVNFSGTFELNTGIAESSALFIRNGYGLSAPLLASTASGYTDGGSWTIPAGGWKTLPPNYTSSDATGCLTFELMSYGNWPGTGWTSNVVCAPPPTCLRPTAITSTPSPVGGTFSWESDAAEHQYRVVALNGAATAPALTQGIVTGDQAVVTGLVGGTQYTFWVRGICTPGDTSAWQYFGYNFMTSFGCGGPFNLNYTSQNTTYPVDRVVPVCPNEAGDVVTLTYTSFNANSFGGDVTLFFHDGPNTSAPLLSSGNGNNGAFPPGGYYQNGVIPGPFTSTHTSGCLTVRIRATGSGSYGATINSNVTCGPRPPCAVPGEVVVSSIGHDAATVTWTGTGNYILEYGPSGFVPGTADVAGAGTVVTNATSPYVLGGISATTTYDVYVRQACDGPTYSNNSFRTRFTTSMNCSTAQTLACGAFNPNTFVSGQTGNAAYDPINYSGSMPCLSGAFQQAWATGPERLYRFTAPAAGDYQLSVLANTSSNYVGYVIAPVEEGCGAAAFECIGVSNNAGATIPMNGLAAGDYYLMVESNSTTSGAQGFQVFCPGAPPCIVNPTFPRNNTSLAAGSTTPIPFSWPAAFGATGYDIYFNDELVVTNHPNTSITSSSYTPANIAALYGIGTPITWRVEARNADGVATGCGNWQFIVGGDGAANAIPITAGEVIGASQQTTNYYTNQWTTTAMNSNDATFSFTASACATGLTATICPKAFTGTNYYAAIYVVRASDNTLVGSFSGANLSLTTCRTLTLAAGLIIPGQNYYLIADSYFGQYDFTITYNEVLSTLDSDSDGVIDCMDECAFIAGGVGDTCDPGAGFENGVINDECECVGTPIPYDCLGVPHGTTLPGTPCTSGLFAGTLNEDCECADLVCAANSITIDILTDANPEQTTWTIYDGSMNEVATGGPFEAANTVVSTDVCLPLSGDAYLFRVEDSFGDGLSGNGYWEVREQGGRVLLRDAFATGTVSPSATPAVASYGVGHQLLLPAGPASISAAYCGVYTYLRQQKVEADLVPGVSVYQFEFADPDAGFMRRIAVPRNWVRFNEMYSVPLVPGVTYFARVRVDQGAVGLGDDRFGGGCEIALQGDQTCTGLIDDASLPTFSCGVTRAFGSNDKIWTYQVPGATQYRFRFVNTASSYTRTIVQSNYQCILNWQSLPLVAGTTYDVSVEAYVSGAWKGYCGPVCQLTIAGGTAPALAPVAGNLEQVLNAQARIQLWPNPNTGDQVNVRAEGFATASNTVAIDVMDLAGKVAYTATVPVMDGLLNTVLDLGHLNNGVYMLRFTTGENMQVERLVISK